jgi:hypothetical protein
LLLRNTGAKQRCQRRPEMVENRQVEVDAALPGASLQANGFLLEQFPAQFRKGQTYMKNSLSSSISKNFKGFFVGRLQGWKGLCWKRDCNLREAPF